MTFMNTEFLLAIQMLIKSHKIKIYLKLKKDLKRIFKQIKYNLGKQLMSMQ